MSSNADGPSRGAPRPASAFSWNWLGVLPFFLFAFAFVFLPSSSLVIRSFQDDHGRFTLANIIGLNDPYIVGAYSVSLKLSLVTALLGGVFGFLVAYAVVLGGGPRPIRGVIMSFSALAAQFGGVPLAFAFIAVIGRTGVITTALRTRGLNVYDLGKSSEPVKAVIDQLNAALGPTMNFLSSRLCQPINLAGLQFAVCQHRGFNLYDFQFNLYTFWGLCLTYLYFQFPLMVLIIAPALEGLKREWREASENLGASQWQYWWHVALPILLPSLLGTMILLFGNAFGAYATAYALTSGTLNLVTIVIGAQMSGDVLHNPGFGYALALGMVVIMSISIVVYRLLQRRTERWLRR